MTEALIKEIQTARDQFSDRVSNLENRLKEHKKKIGITPEEADAEMSALGKRYEEKFKAQLKEVNSKLEETTKSLKEHAHQLHLKESINQTLQEEISSLQATLKEQEASSSKDHNKMAETVTQLMQEREILTEKIQKLEPALRHLKAQLEDSLSDNNEQSIRVNSLEKQLEQMSQEVQASKANEISLTDALTSQSRQFQQDLAAKQQETSALSDHINTQNKTIDLLKKQLQEVSDNSHSALSSLQESASNVNELSVKMKEVEVNMNAQLKQERERFAAQAKQLEKKVQEVESIANQLHESEKRAAASDALVAELRKSLATVEETSNQLKESLALATEELKIQDKAQMEFIAKNKKRFKELREQLVHAEKSNNILLSELQKKLISDSSEQHNNSNVSELENTIVELKDKMRDLERMNDTLKTGLETATEEIKILEGAQHEFETVNKKRLKEFRSLLTTSQKNQYTLFMQQLEEQNDLKIKQYEEEIASLKNELAVYRKVDRDGSSKDKELLSQLTKELDKKRLELDTAKRTNMKIMEEHRKSSDDVDGRQQEAKKRLGDYERKIREDGVTIGKLVDETTALRGQLQLQKVEYQQNVESLQKQLNDTIAMAQQQQLQAASSSIGGGGSSKRGSKKGGDGTVNSGGDDVMELKRKLMETEQKLRTSSENEKDINKKLAEKEKLYTEFSNNLAQDKTKLRDELQIEQLQRQNVQREYELLQLQIEKMKSQFQQEHDKIKKQLQQQQQDASGGGKGHNGDVNELKMQVDSLSQQKNFLALTTIMLPILVMAYFFIRH